jgi:predicted metal-dependent TIM-barrel fold hydrolase
MFDALLHARTLKPRDLADLAFFGVTGALVPSDDSIVSATAARVRGGWAETVAAARRLRHAGLAAWAALGIHPARIPLRGLEALLADLPAELGRPEVAAVGAVGLGDGGELAERVLVRQLELCRELRRPVVLAAPWRERERTIKRTLVILREAELEPGRALVVGADPRTVKSIRAVGQLAGVSLSAGASREDPLDLAVRLIKEHGPEGIVLGSDAGQAGGDLLALPRAADRLARAGLSDAVIRRVCGQNALAFLGVDAEALAPPKVVGQPGHKPARKR